MNSSPTLKFLAHTSVPEVAETAGIYILGCFEKRVTVRSQQVRALNLIYSLFKEGRLTAGSEIAIVGGGIAGLTAAAAARRKGCKVTLLEQCPKLMPFLDGSENRWLHPYIYEWPNTQYRSLSVDTEIPLMNWTADRASGVVAQLREKWKEVDEVDVVTSVRDLEILPVIDSDCRRLTWNPGAENRLFKVVILAIGFGHEKSVSPLEAQSYWHDNRIHQVRTPIGEKKEYLVSGCGDGGLIDLLRIRLDSFSPNDAICGEFASILSHSSMSGLADRLCSIDVETAKLDLERQSTYLTDTYRSLEVPRIFDEHIHSRLRSDTIATLNGPSPNPLTLSASILNRLLASRLLFHYKNVDYWHGEISEGKVRKNDLGKWEVSLKSGSRKCFHEVIIRHGTESSLKSFLWLWEKCEKPLKSRNLLDETRVPLWEKDWFAVTNPVAIQQSSQGEKIQSVEIFDDRHQDVRFGLDPAFPVVDSEFLELKPQKQRTEDTKSSVSRLLTSRWMDALRSFSSQPIIWISPTLSKSNELSKTSDSRSDRFVSMSDLISNLKSTIIKAPPQFGLTSLARYICKEAWHQLSSFCLYIDTDSVKSADRYIQVIQRELQETGLGKSDIDCIIIDSWTNYEKSSLKLLKKISEDYRDIPIIVMQTIDDAKFLTEDNSEVIDRKFDVLHLLAMQRNQIRSIVSTYNEKTHIGEDNAVLNKVVSDLEALNMHRTPLNCLTLLKVSEKYFDESPVNRNEMIKMILFLLFNMDSIPRYKSRPDLKDCEYVLGRFCETMLRANVFRFSREYFLQCLTDYCKERVIYLEVEVTFDILYSNNIIVNHDFEYGFRYSTWIYYFAAQRMKQDKKFAEYIFEDLRYASYPEIIEFYTGIDRSRDDALIVLLKDIRATSEVVRSKVGLPDDMNPYRLVQWNPNEDSIKKMKAAISDDVLSSKLPESVKDQYADAQYDGRRPYDQSVQTVMREYSLAILMRNIKAASRALRNSDYADPAIKHELLAEIVISWQRVGTVLLVLSPLLATRKFASFEGYGFILDSNFGDTPEQRLTAIIQSIPYNIVNIFKHDLYSPKMGPLLFSQVSNEKNELKKHELIILLIHTRPNQWRENVSQYIASVSKSSFYLYDVYIALCIQYSYSFVSTDKLGEIAYLIKMVLAKHEYGFKSPSLEKIAKISNKALPVRQVDTDE